MYTDITFQKFESNSNICKLHIEYYQSSDKHLSVYYRLDIIWYYPVNGFEPKIIRNRHTADSML